MNKTIGFVAAGFRPGKKIDEEATIKILEVFAPMIAQAVNAEHASEHEMKRLSDENVRLKVELRERFDFSRLIGNSAPMRQVYDQSVQIARSNTTVLIRGESGTGKGLVAQAIHHNSLRAKRPFVRLTCSNVGLDEKAFSRAEGSTLLLEEVSGLPLESQTKLLNILDDRRERFQANVRFIATSSKNLELLTAKGEMLPGLFARLAEFTISVPPLRERKADILLLAEHLLKKLDAEHKKKVRRISTPAIDMLAAYHFPGNVRELENVVEQALLTCDSSVIHGHHLPPTLQTAEVSDTATTLTLAQAVEAFERDLIIDTLKSTEGNIAKAARRLDSTERILGYKIKNYGIEPRRFRR
ncbi:MAG: sigma-54-dependent Fis family transcriptional regulator [Blastocatellia bacterium]|nr:sigma-54-dependent Fis family transcriptional regulator [Blastocatellia bacterium]